MSRLESYRGEEVVRAFQRAGWKVTRQRSRYVILEKEGYEATLSVPVHKCKTWDIKGFNKRCKNECG